MIKSSPKGYSEVLEYLIIIKEDIASIKEHLKNLNGKVVTNVQNIECNRLENKETDEKVRNLEVKIAYYAGGLLVVWTVFQFLINKLIL